MPGEKKKHIAKQSETQSKGEILPPEETTELVTVPLADFAAQMKELEELRQESITAMEGWQRERADFSNYRKRVERDQDCNQQNLTISVIKKYLVILDDLERAIKTRPVDSESGRWADGIELIMHKLQGILESEGIQTIPAENVAFDPTLHEAISHEANPDYASGQIIEVVQQGYKIGDRVIRPALVRVAQ